MTNVIFDIETAPLPNALEFFEKPEAPSNWKDPLKIAEYIHNKQQEQLNEAALSALTGRVLVIGVLDPNGYEFFEGAESDLLDEFWNYYDSLNNTKGQGRWIGFSSNDFDWPFIIQRSFINAIKTSVRIDHRGYLPRTLVDLRKLWQCGNKQSLGKLDSIAKAMGFGGKTGNGADFAKLYETDKTAALDYLRKDLELTDKIAVRLLPLLEGYDEAD